MAPRIGTWNESPSANSRGFSSGWWWFCIHGSRRAVGWVLNLPVMTPSYPEDELERHFRLMDRLMIGICRHMENSI